jgi:hypothetical protein
MLLILLVVISVALTVAMFATKQMMLGFPCLIFWALAGGYCYQHSTAIWDMYYLSFFASMGMAIFTAYAAFALRRRDLEPAEKDWEDSGKFIDEGKGKKSTGTELDLYRGESNSDSYIDEPSAPSRRTQELHERAALRRTGGRSKVRWGEFK